jgi:hypothetical protein
MRFSFAALKRKQSSTVERVARGALQAAGVGVAAAGLLGYGVFRLVTWPVRALLSSSNNQRNVASFSYSQRMENSGVPFASTNPFVMLMLRLALPGVSSVVSAVAKKALKRLQQTAAVAEKCFEVTAERAEQMGLVVGPLTDVEDDVTQAGEEQVILTFAVVKETGEVVSTMGKCRITFDSKDKKKVKRVHSFYEKSTNGQVVDILLDTSPGLKYSKKGEDDDDDGATRGGGSGGGSGGANRSGSKKASQVLDAEIVEDSSVKNKH